MGTNRNFDTRQAKVCQDTRGGIRCILNAARIKGDRAAEASKEHFSVATFVASGVTSQVLPGKSIGSRVGGELKGLWVKGRHPIVCPHPQLAAFIFKDATDYIAREAILRVVRLKSACFLIQFIQTILRAYPDFTRTCWID